MFRVSLPAFTRNHWEKRGVAHNPDLWRAALPPALKQGAQRRARKQEKRILQQQSEPQGRPKRGGNALGGRIRWRSLARRQGISGMNMPRQLRTRYRCGKKALCNARKRKRQKKLTALRDKRIFVSGARAQQAFLLTSQSPWQRQQTFFLYKDPRRA